MSEQNQIGEISVGVTANTGALEAGLQAAEEKVQEAATNIAEIQKQTEADIAKAAEIAKAKREQIAAAREAIHKRELQDIADLAAAEAAAVGQLQRKDGAGAAVAQAAQTAGMAADAVTKPIAKIMSILGRITAGIGLVTGAIASVTTAYDLLINREQRAADAIKKRQQDFEARNKSLFDLRDKLRDDAEGKSPIQRQIDEINRGISDGIYDRQLGEAVIADLQKKAAEERSKSIEAQLRQEQDGYNQITRQTRLANAEAMGEEALMREQMAIREEELRDEIAREENVTRKALLQDLLNATIRANAAQVADYKKRKEDAEKEATKRAEDEARKQAEAYEKAFEQSAQKIADALSGAFNTAAAASQNLTRQVNSDISQIIPLLQQLVRNQRR